MNNRTEHSWQDRLLWMTEWTDLKGWLGCYEWQARVFWSAELWFLLKEASLPPLFLQKFCLGNPWFFLTLGLSLNLLPLLVASFQWLWCFSALSLSEFENFADMPHFTEAWILDIIGNCGNSVVQPHILLWISLGNLVFLWNSILSKNSPDPRSSSIHVCCSSHFCTAITYCHCSIWYTFIPFSLQLG